MTADMWYCAAMNVISVNSNCDVYEYANMSIVIMWVVIRTVDMFSARINAISVNNNCNI